MRNSYLNPGSMTKQDIVIHIRTCHEMSQYIVIQFLQTIPIPRNYTVSADTTCYQLATKLIIVVVCERKTLPVMFANNIITHTMTIMLKMQKPQIQPTKYNLGHADSFHTGWWDEVLHFSCKVTQSYNCPLNCSQDDQQKNHNIIIDLRDHHSSLLQQTCFIYVIAYLF